MNDILIKHAIVKDSSNFIDKVKSILSEKFGKIKNDMKITVLKTMSESDDNPLSVYGITSYKSGDDYSAAGTKTFVANSDDIANDIAKQLDAKKVTYVRTGLNFVITSD